jgi:large subunit ribosomal protein L10
MVTRTLFLLSLGYAAAFTGPSFVSSSSRRTTIRSSPLFGGALGYASSLEGKKTVVGGVQTLLDSSEMIFTVPVTSLTVAQTQALRRAMPTGTTVKVVKNKLMSRAVQGTEYEAATNLLKGPNMWFFIEEDIGGTIKAYKQFLKERKIETNQIVGGVIEGISYDTAGVEAIGLLPSKQELYGRIAASIKAVPTKVARVIKAPGNKLARAIKLATDEVNKE